MRLLKVFFFTTSLAFLGQAVQAETAPDAFSGVVNLNRDIVVEGDIVYLSDIFSGLKEEQNTAIAHAPELGKNVDLDARWLWALAQKHDVNWQPNSRFDTTSVSRAGQKIDADQIKNSVEVALLEQGLADGHQIEFDLKDRALEIPAEVEPSLRVESINYREGQSRFSAQIVIPAEGRPVITKVVSGYLIKVVNVPVLNRRLSKGDIIRDHDINWITLKSTKLSKNAITDLESLIGMTPKHSIKPESVIRTNDLDTPKAVNKNSLVTIQLNSGPLVLRTQGRALDSGAMGDVIRILNTQSNTIVNGTVTGEGLATVQLISSTIVGN
ncbi:flagellar basal body P-ring formation chaperone FlgA [Kiloniella laminariae]|uniref:flagellar basal body P-ring formation chaperone FlgA n=1 Tax=Kiloniella laminariae TaxID=454162 RepID=UPI00037440D5|nr:flagellar basal body P-ring formation chaperone FlgA [Kiloniella laminariae]